MDGLQMIVEAGAGPGVGALIAVENIFGVLSPHMVTNLNCVLKSHFLDLKKAFEINISYDIG